MAKSVLGSVLIPRSRALTFAAVKIADLVDQDQAARAAVELYGFEAAAAVAHCALEAHFGGRPDDGYPHRPRIPACAMEDIRPDGRLTESQIEWPAPSQGSNCANWPERPPAGASGRILY
ncbi:hypothetical protein X744_16980 [Mesorhizobium sp. LNJC372A00]|nr:hypothetical protein X745_22470 [Mesorhizobium sp. LNJC374B00]ESY58466.1 hypothetical protein X744_16980 [Mesorhizobium sp. LNJC372A00]